MCIVKLFNFHACTYLKPGTIFVWVVIEKLRNFDSTPDAAARRYFLG